MDAINMKRIAIKVLCYNQIFIQYIVAIQYISVTFPHHHIS